MCITIGFNFSWDKYNTQEKLETIIMQKFCGETSCIIVYTKMVNNLILECSTLQSLEVSWCINFVFQRFGDNKKDSPAPGTYNDPRNSLEILKR